MFSQLLVKSQDISDLRSLINDLPDGEEKVDHLLELTKVYTNQGLLDSARFYCDRSRVLSEKLDYKRGLANYWLRTCQICCEIPDYRQALESIEKYQDMMTALKDTLKIGVGYYWQAIILRETSRTDEALIASKKCLALFEDSGNDMYMMAIMNNLSNIFKDKSQFDSATIYSLRGIEIAESIGDSASLAIMYDNLGSMYLISENFDIAKRYLEMALELNLKLENREYQLGKTYNNLGRLATEEKRYLDAYGYYDQAAEYYTLANRQLDLCHLYNNYGSAFHEQGKYELAREYYDKALQGYQEFGYLEGIVTSMRNKAVLYHNLGDYSMALQLLDSTHRLVTEEGSLELLTWVLGNKAELYRDMGDAGKAYEYLDRYYEVRDSLDRLFQSEVTQDLLLKYEKEKDQAMIISLENENLKKDLQLGQRTTQRNAILFSAIVLIALAVFVVLYFRQKAIKDRIIARQKIQQLEEEKKLMAAKLLVEGQETERKRIAQELHDGLGVLLSATRMQFTSIKDVSPESQPIIEKATQMLEQASGDVRKISHNMMPGLLTKLGLFEAVEDLFENLKDTENLTATCVISGEPEERMPENKEIMIYRIVQELVNNTLKHANASKIELSMKVIPDGLHIRYFDDGRGFDVEKTLAMETGSFGLKSMESRVNFLNGKMDIQSAPGKGVEFSIKIPL
jgi:signal transduction histidine kinase